MRDPLTGRRYEGLRVIGTLLLCGPVFCAGVYGLGRLINHVS